MLGLFFLSFSRLFLTRCFAFLLAPRVGCTGIKKNLIIYFGEKALCFCELKLINNTNKGI